MRTAASPSILTALAVAAALALAGPGALAKGKSDHAGNNGNGNGRGQASAPGQAAKGNPGKGGPGKAAYDAAHGGTSVVISGDDLRVRVSDGVSIRFSDNEVRIIDDYYRRYPAQVQALPPGIAKNLARGKPLPPGIAKKALPARLSARLPALREGTNRVIVGDDLVLVDVSTGLILDILNGVLN